MSDELTYNVSIKGVEELIAKLKAPQKVLKKGLHEAGTYIAGWIQENRLTGPRPQFLGVKTGRLRASITSQPDGDYQEKIGTNVVYARIHEFGGVIQRYPRTSLREMQRYLKGDKKGAFKKGSPTSIDIAGYGQYHVVSRGFTYGAYKINIPARPFLRPALQDEDNKQMIIDILTENINSALIGADYLGGA